VKSQTTLNWRVYGGQASSVFSQNYTIQRRRGGGSANDQNKDWKRETANHLNSASFWRQASSVF
jgi:hypothetical protein